MIIAHTAESNSTITGDCSIMICVAVTINSDVYLVELVLQDTHKTPLYYVL